jgi:ATP-dependent 26S proteasome regulatory subunit
MVAAFDDADIGLQYLQAELRRIDARIGREVRRWQLAGQAPSDEFRGLYLSDAQAVELLDRPFGTSWGQTVTLSPEEEQSFSQAQSVAEQQASGLAEMALRQGRLTRLQHLVDVFGLDRFELDILLISFAPFLDLRYERLYGYLQDDVTKKQASINLVLDLLSAPGPARLRYLAYFADDARLFRNRLLELMPNSGEGGDAPLLGRMLHPDAAVVTWLLGGYQPHEELRPHARLLPPQETEEDRLLAGVSWPDIEWVIEQEPLLVFYGPDKAAQQAAGRLVAVNAKRPLLSVNLQSVVAANQSLYSAVVLALRDARLIGAIPFLAEWDACLVDSSPSSSLLAELLTYPHMAIVAGEESWLARGVARSRNLLWTEFPVPTYPQRRDLWRHFANRVQVQPNLDLDALAGQFILTAGQIRDAVATARDIAAGRRDDAIQLSDLFAAARLHSNPHLAGLARKIEPRYTWEDIILPKDQLGLLNEIVDTVRERPKVLEEWRIADKLAASSGVTVLFAGPPGTGKTMAAEVIAGQLGLDLYKIDLSTVVSKYIGETEKNLERIFSEAQSSNAILFFDEADALFGKRSEVKDAHDRYANIEISYLLQRMEVYDGVTILATNLRANLDEAFTRRLQFAVDFPFPEEEDRLRIWETLFPSDVPCSSDIDLPLLARRFKLAGGNIRNVIVNATFLAAADGGLLTMKHFFHSTRRELQKMGRLVDEDDLTFG